MRAAGDQEVRRPDKPRSKAVPPPVKPTSSAPAPSTSQPPKPAPQSAQPSKVKPVVQQPPQPSAPVQQGGKPPVVQHKAPPQEGKGASKEKEKGGESKRAAKKAPHPASSAGTLPTHQSRATHPSVWYIHWTGCQRTPLSISMSLFIRDGEGELRLCPCAVASGVSTASAPASSSSPLAPPTGTSNGSSAATANNPDAAPVVINVHVPSPPRSHPTPKQAPSASHSR
jgi:hypothetical protein